MTYMVQATDQYQIRTNTAVLVDPHFPEGTHLVVKETGFDEVPAERREEAYNMHVNGWT